MTFVISERRNSSSPNKGVALQEEDEPYIDNAGRFHLRTKNITASAARVQIEMRAGRTYYCMNEGTTLRP